MGIPMLATLLISTALTLGGPTPSACSVPLPATGDDTLRALYEGGVSFDDFLGNARRRVELWKRLAEEGRVDPALVERARALGGTWRILAVAEDWCGDSANNLPYVAELVGQVPGLELRVVDSRVGRSVMESHRTPDGRPATPTFLLLDAGWNEVGCFVERPSGLMAWYMEHRAEMSSDEIHEYVGDFYVKDAGRATATDVVELLEAAAAGRPRCIVGAG
jgi:hypothetical protein